MVVAGVGGWLAASAGIVVLGALVGLSVLLTSLVKWRFAVLAALAYVPYSGVLSALLYPRTYLADAVRDVLVIAPLYVPLFLEPRSSVNRKLPRRVVWLLSAMAGLAVLQAFNPSLPNVMVAIIGLRSWLFFVPLMVVGMRVVRDEQDVFTICRVATVSAFPALLVGLYDAFQLRAGHGGLLVTLFPQSSGLAADFGRVELGATHIHRVSGLFGYPIAYFCFCIAILVPAFALWRGGRSRRERGFGVAVMVTAVVAAMTSGTRLALVLVPSMLLVAGSLVGAVSRRQIFAVTAGGLASALWLLHVPVTGLPGYLLDLGAQERDDVLIDGLALARRLTLLGLGTGSDNNAARHFGGNDFFDRIGGRWQESFVVKSWLELGVVGLVLVLALMVVLCASLFHAARAVKGLPAAPFVAMTAAYVTAAALLSVKGAVIDQAPSTIYVWFFIGVAYALGSALPAVRVRQRRGAHSSEVVAAVG
jgi:hypothetical protein